MNTSSPRGAKGLALQSVAAAALGLGCLGAWALPTFTLNPSAASPVLTGGTVTADNIIVSDYSHVVSDLGAQTFSETGLLSVQGFQLAGAAVSSPGLNTSYGLYIGFNATGVQKIAGNPLTSFTAGSFTSLSYTLYGYNGPSATFSFDAAHNPTTTASGVVALATGSLIQGSVSTSPSPSGTPSFVPSANATVTFNPLPAQAAFFQAPAGFYDLGFAAFTNTVSQVEVLSANEFLVRQGGGAFNFAATPVPEPETYALLMAGLAAVGFVVNRRKM